MVGADCRGGLRWTSIQLYSEPEAYLFQDRYRLLMKYLNNVLIRYIN